MKPMKRRIWCFMVVALCLLVAACAGPIRKAEIYEDKQEWISAVIEYRKAYNDDPRNVEYKARLKHAEFKAADYYYRQGMLLLEREKIDESIVQFQQGLTAMPGDERLMQAMNKALAKREANNLYQEGVLINGAGNVGEAKRIFQRAVNVYPDHKAALEALANIENKTPEERDGEKFSLTSTSPISLNFRQTDMRSVFEFVAKSFGINIIFDEGIKTISPVTVFAKDVSFEQALALINVATKTFYKKISKNTIIVVPDSKDKRGQYEDHVMRTFYLSTIRAKEVADILRGVMTIRKIIVNEQLNTLVVRDTDEVIRQVAKIIDINDRKPAEIVLEVEILEMNRTKAERLGLDLGSYQISATVPSAIALSGSISGAIEKASLLTLPSATFRFFKQDVDARTLANPKIRVVNGKSAKIHIGDRVPLRVSTIINTTGQVNTTYDYKDIGIKLNVEPTINLDNSSLVKLSLEVSSLGANLGTATEPAYRIGTRNAETLMLLRDGETAILGGLIRDEDRKTVVRIPLLGDIPAAGSLFSSYDMSKERTDVLLTITPRVVRGWDLPAKEARQFYSGTEDKYLDQAPFQSLASPSSAAAKENAGIQESPQVPVNENPAVPPSSGQSIAPGIGGNVIQSPALVFSKPAYMAINQDEVDVQLLFDNPSKNREIATEIQFNPKVLQFVGSDAGEFNFGFFQADKNEAGDVVRLSAGFANDALSKEKGILATLRFRALKPGVSALTYGVSSVKNAAGDIISPQSNISRVIVR
jgi:general secretion pathway protein D